MFYNRDRVKNFVELLEDDTLAANLLGIKPDDLKKLPGDLSECVLFHRVNDLDELESEDDEKYIFATPDSRVIEEFNKFQTKSLFKRFGPQFDEEKVDLLFRLIWNYKTLAINRKSAKYEIYSGFTPLSKYFTANYGGGIPRKIIVTE